MTAKNDDNDDNDDNAAADEAHESSPMWRLADSLFGRSSIIDEQRNHRLQSCVQLERAWEHCERRRRRWSADFANSTLLPGETETVQLQDSRSGLKISRFYDWGLSRQLAGDSNKKDQVTQTLSSSSSSTINNISSCNREMHAIWACRALSLGCGKPLIQLKQCFQSKQNWTDPPCSYHDPTPTATQDTKGQDECRLEQKQIVQCVHSNEKKLQQRRSHPT